MTEAHVAFRYANIPPCDASLVCPICGEPFVEPLVTNCPSGHTFCKTCVRPHLKRSYSCPVCSEQVSKLTPAHRIVRQALDALEVFCPNSPACAAVVTRGALPEHLMDCPGHNVQCPECGRNVPRSDLVRHQVVCTARRGSLATVSSVFSASPVSSPIDTPSHFARATPTSGERPTERPRPPPQLTHPSAGAIPPAAPVTPISPTPAPSLTPTQPTQQPPPLPPPAMAVVHQISERELALQAEVEKLRAQRTRDMDTISQQERDINALRMELNAAELKFSNEITRLRTMLEMAETSRTTSSFKSSPAPAVPSAPVWRQGPAAPSTSGSHHSGSHHSGKSGNSSRKRSTHSKDHKSSSRKSKSEHSYKSDSKNKKKDTKSKKEKSKK